MNAIDDFILGLPADQGALVGFHRTVIKSQHTGISERIAYGIPFFYYKKPLCYINVKEWGVDLGFVNGTGLAPRAALVVGNRKTVRSIGIAWQDEVDIILLVELVQEALVLQDH